MFSPTDFLVERAGLLEILRQSKTIASTLPDVERAVELQAVARLQETVYRQCVYRIPVNVARRVMCMHANLLDRTRKERTNATAQAH